MDEGSFHWKESIALDDDGNTLVEVQCSRWNLFIADEYSSICIPHGDVQRFMNMMARGWMSYQRWKLGQCAENDEECSEFVELK